MDIDDRGRIWVTEAVNYRRWGGRNPGRSHPEGVKSFIEELVVRMSDEQVDDFSINSLAFPQLTLWLPELMSR